MTAAPQVSTTVLRVLAEIAGVARADITADTPLRRGLIDSLDLAEAAQVIEDELGIAIPGADLDAATTVGELLTLCERLVATGRAR